VGSRVDVARELDTLKRASAQMAKIWHDLLPGLRALADMAERQANESTKLSSVANRLLGTHTGLIDSVSGILEEYNAHGHGDDGRGSGADHTTGNDASGRVGSIGAT
jgi:hypothetical protein